MWEPRHATPQPVPVDDCIVLSFGAAPGFAGIDDERAGFGAGIPLRVLLSEAFPSWQSGEADPLWPSSSSSDDPVGLKLLSHLAEPVLTRLRWRRV